MDKTIRLATKDNQEKILAVLGGEDSAGAGGLVEQMKTAVTEALGNPGGAIRDQQPTNLLEFYAMPKGNGIATAWRDPVDQTFFDRYGLADSTWVKTVVVASQDHFPESPTDGTAITNTVRNLYLTPDGEDVRVGSWYLWDLDPTKTTYFRFYTYGRGGTVNDNPKNAITYRPDKMGAVIFGASKERLMELFETSHGFGEAVRIGYGLTDEIVEGAKVAEMDGCNTYASFLARKDLLNAATSRGNALARSVWYSQNFDVILKFFAAGPKYHDGKVVTWVMERPIKNSSGTILRNAVAASDTAMAAVLASDTAMAAVLASDTAMAAVAASDTAMAAVAASDTAMAAVLASDTAMAAVVRYGTESSLKPMVTALSTTARARRAYATVSRSNKFKRTRGFRGDDSVSSANVAKTETRIIFAVLGRYRSDGKTTMASCGAQVSGTTNNLKDYSASSFAGSLNAVGFKGASFTETTDGFVLTELWEVV